MKAKSVFMKSFIVLWFLQSIGLFAAYTDYNDGQLHIFNGGSTGDRVRVDFQTYQNPGTELRFYEGASTGASLSTYGYSKVDIYEGRVAWQLVSLGSSSVTLYDANIGEGVWAQENSTIDIYGAQVNSSSTHGLHVLNQATINLFGNFPLGLEIDGYSYLDGSYYGRLNGTFINGEVWTNMPFRIHHEGRIIIQPIPEPCTLVLLGLGGLLIRKRT